MAQIRKAISTITVPHLSSPISALSAESNSNITTLRFNVHETFHNKSNFLIFNKTVVQGL